MSTSTSYLTSLYSNTTDTGPSLLNTLYGIGGSSAGTTNPVQALRAAEANQTKEVKLTGTQPMVKADMAAFTKAVNSAKSMTQLLANPAFMKVLLTANSLSDQVGYTALATKALTSDLTDPKSLANNLTNTSWKKLAKTYDFSAAGLASFKKPETIAAIASAYTTAAWQTSKDTVTPGLSNALAFKARASSISSVIQVLGDMTLRTVITTALGIPKQIAFQTINAQEKAIATRIDVKQFQDPKFVDKFVQRYLIANAAEVAKEPSTTPTITSLAGQMRGVSV